MTRAWPLMRQPAGDVPGWMSAWVGGILIEDQAYGVALDGRGRAWAMQEMDMFAGDDQRTVTLPVPVFGPVGPDARPGEAFTDALLAVLHRRKRGWKAGLKPGLKRRAS